MKQLTRILAILLAAVMVFSIVACQATDTPADSTPGPSSAPGSTDPTSGPADPGPPDPGDPEPATITVMQWALDNQTTDFENLWYYQQIEEMTGVKVNWIIVKESDWREQLNLTFASLDWPDVIIRPDQSLSIEEYGVTQGILLPLDDYIDQYMPNYAARVAYNDFNGQTSSLRASDGNMYFLGFLIAQNINHNSHFFINQTWLDAVSKSIPTTIDELTDVLRAFKAEAPGADSVFPMSAGGGIEHQTNGIYPYFGMFGVPLTRWVHATVDNNFNAVFPGYMDGFREACEWLALCYAEGLLDPDAITQDENAWNEKVNSDQVGFQVYLRLINSAWANPDTIQNWTSILPPEASRGATVPRELEIPEFGAVVTAAAADKLPAVFRWLDAQYDPEMMMIASNGPTELTDDLIAILGEDWESDKAPLVFENGQFVVTDVPANNALYKLVPVTQGQFFAPGDWYFDIFELPPHRIERRDYAAEYQAAGVVEQNSYMILTRILKPAPDDAAELTRLGTDIESLMKTTISNFIINGVTDATWDTFLSEAENVGVGRYLEIYQKYLDEYYG
ncbi:MAG: extracellular solute-binding protein [Oscillospiraceae bacterium]|nr:extracellular solute-binding protein [Oscillospiraceae bacterium]